jgi:hypothetical protein
MRVVLFSFALLGGLTLAGCSRAPAVGPVGPTPANTATPPTDTTGQTDDTSSGESLAAAIVNDDFAGAGDGVFAKPVRVKAGSTFIDTEIGHAAPYVADIDQDGKRDLLVGQFGGGKLKICKNIGSNKAPRYAAPTFFEAGGEVVTTDAG